MSKELVHVPRITKMAKYLQAVNNNRELNVSHLRVLAVIREMNTTVQIIAGLTGMAPDKVRERVNDLHRWGLASVTELRARSKKIWGMHDDFRSENKVPTYPSVTQEASMELKRKKAGRKLEMDEVATILWGGDDNRSGAVSAALVEVSTSLKKTPIETRVAGDVAARRQAGVTDDKISWSLEDFVESDEEE